ncbi:hypothetical protein GOP47_0024500 [Adiantum capillus-veneris]|uniref:Copine C-terminal domain-containing protein n=1 Tax=Adiantum capillus-veneris TaxID=13818 RepID=A0A9D4U294_ADICA|nr:hypothetical protein GOP47_0024500 [Adiantum capillus-veneris]
MSCECEFNDIYEVRNALNEAGLESASLIIGIDFTKSNEWTGRHSFDGMNLHTIANGVTNPYQHVISIVGTTLLGYDDDKKIPCFGFGDATTHDRKVFPFYHDGQPCHGIEGVLERYEQLVSHVTLSGPTSFAPLIHAAIDIVRQSGNQFHVLLIIADGQVTGDIGLNGGRLSQQEKETIDAIVAASNYPLSIVMVGVGDGPWHTMELFDDAIPTRKFDNFQFVNYTEICAEYRDPLERETEIATEALMEIPNQYSFIKQMRAVSYPSFKSNNAYVVQPPGPKFSPHQQLVQGGSKRRVRISSGDGRKQRAQC